MLIQLHEIANRVRGIMGYEPLQAEQWIMQKDVSFYQINKFLAQIHLTLKRIKRLRTEVASRQALINYIEQCNQ